MKFFGRFASSGLGGLCVGVLVPVMLTILYFKDNFPSKLLDLLDFFFWLETEKKLVDSSGSTEPNALFLNLKQHIKSDFFIYSGC